MDHSITVGSMSAVKFPTDVKLVVNGKKYCLPYFFADQIYSDWRLFVKNITDSNMEEEMLPTAAQEAAWKDVEQALRVSVARFHILCNAV